MTPAEHAALEVLATFESGQHDRVHDLVTADFVDHGAPAGLPPGPDGYIAVLRYLTEVLQIRYEVHDVLAAGDRVAIRATAHGIHNTSLVGAPTGKPYAMATMHLYRADGDRLAEHWGVRDEYGVLVQVGALPVPRLPADLPSGR
jgi:predicted ester cyclase